MEAPQKEELKPCRICVDFYGTASTDFLCSKCHREESKQATAAQAQTNEIERLMSGHAPEVM